MAGHEDAKQTEEYRTSNPASHRSAMLRMIGQEDKGQRRSTFEAVANWLQGEPGGYPERTDGEAPKEDKTPRGSPNRGYFRDCLEAAD